MKIITVATFSLPSDAAEEPSVVSRAQYGEMGHRGAPRHTPVEYGFHNFGFQHPYFEPERCGGLVVQWQAIPSKIKVRQKYAPIHFDSKLSIFAHGCLKVHIFGGLLVYLAGCLSNESSYISSSGIWFPSSLPSLSIRTKRTLQ